MIPIDGQKPSDFGILRWQRWQNMLVTECCEWGMEKSSKHFLQYLGSTDSRLMPVVSRNINKFTSFQQKWPDWGHRSPFKWANELQPGHCPNSSHRKGCQGRPSKPTHRSVARSTRCGHHGAHSTFRSTELTNWMIKVQVSEHPGWSCISGMKYFDIFWCNLHDSWLLCHFFAKVSYELLSKSIHIVTNCLNSTWRTVSPVQCTIQVEVNIHCFTCRKPLRCCCRLSIHGKSGWLDGFNVFF